MIYFIRAGTDGAVKIGHGHNPQARLRDLQTGNHEKLTMVRVAEGGFEEERWLHHQYRALSLRGEWFTYCPTMMTVAPQKYERLAIPQPPRPSREKRQRDRTTAFERALAIVGGATKLAKILGVSPQLVFHWRTKSPVLPAARVIPVVRATGGKVAPSELRPDIYPPDDYPPSMQAA